MLTGKDWLEICFIAIGTHGGIFMLFYSKSKKMLYRIMIIFTGTLITLGGIFTIIGKLKTAF